LIDGEITVAAKTNYGIPFTVDANMTEVKVEGKFSTLDGRRISRSILWTTQPIKNGLKESVCLSFSIQDRSRSDSLINHSISGHILVDIYELGVSGRFSPEQGVSAKIDLKWVY